MRSPNKRSRTRFVPRTITGAKPLKVMPGFLPPALATLRTTVPPGDGWIHEIKFDGYRIQPHLVRSSAIIYTRNGHDWTNRFSTIASAVSHLPAERLILDGEVVVAKDGRSNFSELQADLAVGRRDRMALYVFDILSFDGFDLRDAPLTERKRVLAGLLAESRRDGPVIYSDHFESDGDAVFRHSCGLGFEGIVSKRRDAPYRSGRAEDWIKVKCVQCARYPIIGFVPETASIAALYLGRQDGKDLIYAGKVGTGFSRKTAAAIRRQLDAIATPTSRLTVPIRKPKARWVEPKLWAEVDYRDITSDCLLRHSSFQGLFDSQKSSHNLTPK
jgi:bifunctional non-homologous end joining protein LigD